MAFPGCLTGLREAEIVAGPGRAYFGITPAELDMRGPTYRRTSPCLPGEAEND